MRSKLLFDKQKLFDLTDKLDNTQRGVFFSLLRFLFTSKLRPHVMVHNEKPLSQKQVISLIAFHGDMNEESAKSTFDHFRSIGLLSICEPSETASVKDFVQSVVCPLVEHQWRVSQSKIRKHLPVKKQQKDQDKPQNKEKPQEQSQITAMFALQGDETSVNKKIAVEIIDRLNKVSGKKRGFTTKQVNIKPIIARLRDGFKREELELVVDYLSKKWKDTESEFYLRPVTIFREKNFESYLHEAERKHQNQKSDHRINRYIHQYFKRVSDINIQMSSEECEKISKLIDAATLKKYLIEMENSKYLGNSVYLSLVEKINRSKTKQDDTIIKSNAL